MITARLPGFQFGATKAEADHSQIGGDFVDFIVLTGIMIREGSI
jgi:hypothetical protein